MKENPNLQKVLEGLFNRDEISSYNELGYNIYYRPNYPKNYTGGTVKGFDIDIFEYVFIDFDKKESALSVEDFIKEILSFPCEPSSIVYSGNGVHVYWKVSDLDALSFLRISRRLMRKFNTDDAVQTLAQLMRLPETLNTKNKDNLLECIEIHKTNKVYTCEELSKALPIISKEDEEYCIGHFNRVTGKDAVEISDKLPLRFSKLLRKNQEVNDLFIAPTTDRSKNDFRLGHILFGEGFDKDEAMSVLANTAKALTRAPIHRISYAKNIVDKIWIDEEAETFINLSPTVRDILERNDNEDLLGKRFPCHKLIDDTKHGYRLGQVIGIIGGSGVGKTTLTLNAFLWFAHNNPEYHHFFFSLEQPAGEIALRTKTICKDNTNLFDKIHIVSNYNDKGEFIHFSLSDIEAHLFEFQERTGFKVGAVVIDHIGVLKKETKNGENDGLIGICNKMKALAVKLQVMLIMLSQAPREKAGIGDLELNKDAAYGTVFFESFVDFLICLWQPLKRVYHMGAPTIMAFKFAKIRHKNQKHDVIKEDIRYQLFFDPETESLREVTQEEEKSLVYWNGQAVNQRKLDKKTDILTYVSRKEDQINEERKPDTH